ncbi:hypothetical protein K492DRAFT_195363 [Lichtheimia hyalospora FSU 10163]|nr:hypothetical protein K492DRAFT_195363 [Lichtheimia hyalospora FSU 10163]
MNSLPHEVIFSIVSHLEPMDCIECYQVSRQWQLIIPSFASRPWQDITVNNESFWMLSYVSVFGRHIRTVRIVLQDLRKAITALDRLKLCPLLQKLGHIHITLSLGLEAQLISCFQRWSKLDTLAIIDVHAPKVNLVDYILLATHYNIRHIACICNEKSLFQVQEWRLHTSNISKLVSLVINHENMDLFTIQTLLSFTPNIEYLELGSCFTDKLITQSIFTLCPKITHIHLADMLESPDEDIYPRDYLQFPTRAAVSDDQQDYPRLRYYWNNLTNFDQYEWDLLLRYQSTLEHVCMGHCYHSSFIPKWKTFIQCFLPNTTLKHLLLPLHCQRSGPSIQYEDGYAHWLNACQALEHLELPSVWCLFGATMMHTLEHQLPSLRRIDITFQEICKPTHLVQLGTTGDLFLNQLQLLRALRYRCKHTDSLKELQLNLSGHHNNCDIATILSMVTSIRSLEKLTVDTTYYDCDDEPEILAFIKNLQFGLPLLKHLRLDGFFAASAKVIYALATLSWIKSLALVDSTITLNEAELLINTMGKHLKYLYFANCGLSKTRCKILSLAQDYAIECHIDDDDDT